MQIIKQLKYFLSFDAAYFLPSPSRYKVHSACNLQNPKFCSVSEFWQRVYIVCFFRNFLH